MEITLLKQTGGEAYVMELSNGESIKTVLSVVSDYSLYEGRELSDEELEAVRDASSLGRAKLRALRIIGAAAMSETALYERLVQKGESEKNAAACIAWLKSLGFLNDEAYAKQLVSHYAAKGYGKMRVRDELYRHKVPRRMWEDALSDFPDQSETIDKFLRTKIKSDNPDRKELKRASDALIRRGYSWNEVREAMNRYNGFHEDE